ncbi:MAG: hypothetical protein IPQ07_26655 [Myxococcales bacterium]|nr:hypothetical protein [Myxococcales bacterium]
MYHARNAGWAEDRATPKPDPENEGPGLGWGLFLGGVGAAIPLTWAAVDCDLTGCKEVATLGLVADGLLMLLLLVGTR